MQGAKVEESKFPQFPWGARPEYKRVTEKNSLRRIAHVARRSRWPLLRNIVAESIRCVLEPQELDKLPLPSEEDYSTLFELVCMVRILKEIKPTPGCIRWMDNYQGNNRVELPGVLTLFFQHSIKAHHLQDSDSIEAGLKKALNRHKIMPARDADGWFEFDEDQDCRGFNGILVEAKSGITQDFRDAVPQLRIYRSALNPSEKQRLLVWGIVEKEELEEDAGLNTVMSNSFGFGGTNSSLVFTKS